MTAELDCSAVVVERDRLRELFEEIYPTLASRTLELWKEGEMESARFWNKICRKVIEVLGD